MCGGEVTLVWEFETPEGHTVTVALSPDAAAVTTRLVHGAVDGEVLDLDTFESAVMPGLEPLADAPTLDALRASLRLMRSQRDFDDDEVP